jgi:hypothetical protein
MNDEHQKMLMTLLLASALCAAPAVAREQNVGGTADRSTGDQNLNAKAQQFAQEEGDLTVRQNQMQLLDEEEAAQAAKQGQQQVAMSERQQQADDPVTTIIILQSDED